MDEDNGPPGTENTSSDRATARKGTPIPEKQDKAATRSRPTTTTTTASQQQQPTDPTNPTIISREQGHTTSTNTTSQPTASTHPLAPPPLLRVAAVRYNCNNNTQQQHPDKK